MSLLGLLACLTVAREEALDRPGGAQTRVVVERAHLPARALPPLEGTSWTLDTTLPGAGPTRYELILAPGGALESMNPRDTTPDDDAWRVEGPELVLDLNAGFSQYRGRFTSAIHVQGEAVNARGEAWAFTLTRTDPHLLH